MFGILNSQAHLLNEKGKSRAGALHESGAEERLNDHYDDGRIPECWWCKEVVQSVEHLYTKCRRWRKEQRKLVRELDKEGVLWQAQGERRWLAGLLGNEKAVAPLLRFLKTTDVGGRGAREREIEWERKNDQAGEDLLG